MLTSPTSGTQLADRVLANIRLQQVDKTISSVAAGGDNVIDGMKIDYLVQANWNEIDTPNDNWEWRSGTTAVGRARSPSIATASFISRQMQARPIVSIPRFCLCAARFHTEIMEEEALIGRINFQWDFDDAFYLKAGVKAARTDRELDTSEVQYDPTGNADAESGLVAIVHFGRLYQ